MTAGGWSALRVLNDDDKKVFEMAFANFEGASYEPLIAESQVVEGINYRFICNATPVTVAPETYAAIVTVWSKTDGSVEITDIKKLNDLL